MEKNTEFICFTSSHGGCGVSSAAIAISRIMTMLYGKKMLVISIDTLSSKMAPKGVVRLDSGKMLVRIAGDMQDKTKVLDYCTAKDSFGVSYFTDKSFYNPLLSIDEDILFRLFGFISGSLLYDAVIIDLPVNNTCFEEILRCCEKTVIVESYNKKENTVSKEFIQYIDKCIDKDIKCSEIHVFSPLEDKESFETEEVDIHGQFAAEVRELAEKLFSL